MSMEKRYDWAVEVRGSCDLYTLDGKYWGPASEVDIQAYVWHKSNGRPWIVRGGVQLKVKEVLGKWL